MATYTVKVEEGRQAEGDKPSAGPVYRCIYAKGGLLEVPEGLQSPWQNFSESSKRFPNNPMLGRRKVADSEVGPYTWLTYQEAHQSAIQIGSAMRNSGVNPGDCCGIYGLNCPEWIIAMEACMSQAITYVPLYDTLGANAVEFIINHADISIAFVQENKIQSVLACLPKVSSTLRTIVSFANVSAEHRKAVEEHGVSIFSWEEFAQKGNKDCELAKKEKSNICTIMYTSGTTGEPKGVILSNAAMLAEALSVDQMMELTDRSLNEEDTYFSYLPLAHVYDQILELYCISKGASIGYWRGDVRYMMDDLQELKPTIFCGVPRVYSRIYAAINSKISAGGVVGKKLFEYAYSYKLRNMKGGMSQEQSAPMLDKLVFQKVKQVLGGRVLMLLSGAAPLPHNVDEFFRVVSRANLAQGYGLTESCGGSLTSLANVFSMIGTVGVPMTTIEARLESVPEMGYNALSNVPRGEICLRGNSLFSGYHKRPDLTEQVFFDGWFHTGDIGEWQPDGSMKVIDRKKNIFKLSQGEYVAVENLENTYSRCPLVTQIWVYGNSLEAFLVAVVVPERQAIENWAAGNNVQYADFKTLCESLKVKKYVLDELNSTGKSSNLRGFEMLKAVYLEPMPFDMERDLITPTFKLKRPQLLKHYKDDIDKLYQEAKETKA